RFERGSRFRTVHRLVHTCGQGARHRKSPVKRLRKKGVLRARDVARWRLGSVLRNVRGATTGKQRRADPSKGSERRSSGIGEVAGSTPDRGTGPVNRLTSNEFALAARLHVPVP